MSLWFGKKKAPDGTAIIEHETVERKFGFAPDIVGFAKAREAAYGRLFGEMLTVSHELIPQIPHIDVYTFRRKKGDGFVYALVTGGMSDLPMTMPRGGEQAPKRVELIFYCAEPRDEYIRTLRWLGHFPHDSKSWLGQGHTIPNGNPQEPFHGSADLDTFLFVPPIVAKDQTLPEELKLRDEPVHFLWVVPLTTAECDYKLEKGLDAILGLFQENRHPHVYDPTRKSYV
jgi:hypothetical protein